MPNPENIVDQAILKIKVDKKIQEILEEYYYMPGQYEKILVENILIHGVNLAFDVMRNNLVKNVN